MIAPPTWLCQNQPYLLGFSGGRDSVCLLHWLREHGFRKIIPCHLHHQLRGAEADRDAKFVKHFAPESEVGYRDVQAYATEQKLSLETAARECRHEFFRECANKHGCTQILLAHHADDQAETLLFNLLRGSGGLKGMKSEHTIGELTVLRPLLTTRRSEINSYITDHNLEFCEDSTNQDKFATRNRFRNEVMPLLNEILARDPVPAILRAAETANPLEKVLEDFHLLDPQGRLYLPTLRDLPQPVQREALYRFLKKENVSQISQDLVSRACELIKPDTSPALTLAGGLRLRRRQSRLLITP